MAEQPAPLSEEALGLIESDLRAHAHEGPHGRTLMRLKELGALVAEVRRLRNIPHEETAEHWRANAAEETRKKQHVSGLLTAALRERDDARAEVARLRGLLEEYGEHDDECAARHDAACICGWADIERELAGEEAGT